MPTQILAYYNAEITPDSTELGQTFTCFINILTHDNLT